MWIRPRNPNSRTDSPRAPSTRSLSTIRAGSLEARPCLEWSIPRGLHPAFLEPFRRSRSRFVRPTSAIEPTCDEHPRCVWLTAASTSLWLALHRPILRRVFADESRVSRRPTRFDDLVRSSWGVVFTTWTRKKTSLTPLSPRQGSVDRSPETTSWLGQDHSVLGPS